MAPSLREVDIKTFMEFIRRSNTPELEHKLKHKFPDTTLLESLFTNAYEVLTKEKTLGHIKDVVVEDKELWREFCECFTAYISQQGHSGQCD